MTLFTTFDPINNNNFALSGGNLTAGGASTYTYGVKSKDPKTAGKFYAEFTVVNPGVNPYGSLNTTAIGICSQGTSFYRLDLNNDGPINGAMLIFQGDALAAGTRHFSVTGNLVATDIVGLAVDFDNSTVWWRANGGNWNGSPTASPATNSGGFSISGLTPGIVLFMINTASNTGFSVTLNAGASGFSYGPPGGFTGWTENLYGSDLFLPKLTAGLMLSPPNVAVRKITANEILLPPNVAARKITAYLFLYRIPPFGPIPIFPTLPLGFPVKLGIVMDTTLGTTKSLREVRVANQIYPLWDIEILFEELRDQTQNQNAYTPFAGYTQYMQLVQLWIMMYGQTNIFAFDCWWDNSRENQVIGTGDGQTYIFTVVRTWGTGSVATTAPVGLVNTVIDVSVNGVTVSPTNYYIDRNTIYFVDSSGQVHPPAAGGTITMTFSFYYLCRFVEDEQDFEEFAKNRWTVPSLKFQAVIWPESAYSE